MSLPLQPELLPVEIKQQDCRFLVDILQGQGWKTAAEILKMIGHDPKSESAKRALRAIANSSNGRIACGQKGYALTDELGKEEIDHCCKFLNHQAGEMQLRAIQLQKYFYTRTPNPK